MGCVVQVQKVVVDSYSAEPEHKLQCGLLSFPGLHFVQAFRLGRLDWRLHL
jgi:hypothetical protein